jgi:hypothetical protein
VITCSDLVVAFNKAAPVHAGLCRIVVCFGSCQPFFWQFFSSKFSGWLGIFFQFEAFTPKPFCELFRSRFISDPGVAHGITRRQLPVMNHSFVVEIKHLQDFMKPKQAVRLRNRALMQFFGNFCI